MTSYMKGVGHTLLGLGIVAFTSALIIPQFNPILATVGGILIGSGGMLCGVE